nr:MULTISPECIES: Tn3 family transposase [unclassified Streptomyces]
MTAARPRSGGVRRVQADRQDRTPAAGRRPGGRHLLAADEPAAHRAEVPPQARAGRVCHDKRGTIHQAYRDGTEDQLGALGLVRNAIVPGATKYIDAAWNSSRPKAPRSATKTSPGSPRSSTAT